MSMKIFWDRALRLGFALPLLFVAPAVTRADVAITSGTIKSTDTLSNGNSVGVQGTNLSITSGPADLSLGLLVFSPTEETVTFNPAQTLNLSGAGGGGVFYNGTPYSLFNVQMVFTAAPVSVRNAFVTSGAPTGSYGGSVSNVAFSMTGTVTIYSDHIGGTVSQLVPIFGTGTYSANAMGNFLAGGDGSPHGLATYQFAAAPVFGTDTTTQGAFSTNYGGDGFQIANGASQLPPYASVSFPGASTFTWAAQTSDVRALQNGAGATSRIASEYYGNSFNINVNMTDGTLHRVALYLLDWDSPSRAETITIKNAVTNAVIDTESFSSFQNGEYAAWNLSGNVTITVTRTGVGNAVVSGIFFGPSGSPLRTPSPSGASATFVGLNGLTGGVTSVQGNWPGVYGAAGYMIAGGLNSPPLKGVASVAGALTFTWVPQTSDVRALKSFPGSSTGIAAAYTQYAGNSFSINVNITDSVAHAVSLYLLDWDSTSRVETITIRNASSNTLLSMVTFSGFHNGNYATWYIKGNVVITITPNGATIEPVVSGIFFN